MSAALTRRQALQSSLGPLVLGAAGCGRRPPTRPNILFAIADDMSWAHAGAYGDRLARTPVFDRVAGEGVLFRNSFCASPSCTPSRSAVLTGRHMWQVEEAGVLYGTIPAKYPLFTHLLEDSGFHAGYSGKGWGPGDWKAGGLARNPTGREYNGRTHGGGVPEGIDKRDYAANFQDFLKQRPGGAPFCFWFGSTEPHRAYGRGLGLRAGKRLEDVAAPPFLPDSAEMRSDLLDYANEIEWFDTQLGRMLDVLKASGELENTLVVVTSDNGLPFPRAKTTLYDWGVRMPLAVRWGARVQAGRVVDDMVSHVDFAPTFLDAAGISPPQAMTGRSLLPVLEAAASGTIDPRRDRVFTGIERHTMCRPDGAGYPSRAIRTPGHLYIRNFAPGRWPTGGPDFVSSNKTFHGDVDGGPAKDFMLAPENQRRYSREFQLCFGKRPAEELYDVAADPGQTHNLAESAAHRDTMAALRSQLETYLRQTGDPRIDGRDPWQGYVYRQTTGYGASFNRSYSEEQRRQFLERERHKPE
ncbi:MAG: sulfatase [Candidatus Solibacter usitatus]|nr:sulfatase [Candidatus Solibacter usitatus]